MSLTPGIILPCYGPDQPNPIVFSFNSRSKNGILCKGADANRNWGFHFNDGGSSDQACSETYHGPEAFSEVENQV